MQVMPTPNRTVTLAIAFLSVGFYWWIFLSQPLLEGSADISRGAYVLWAVLYPEGYLIDSWTDSGPFAAGLFRSPAHHRLHGFLAGSGHASRLALVCAAH